MRLSALTAELKLGTQCKNEKSNLLSSNQMANNQLPEAFRSLCDTRRDCKTTSPSAREQGFSYSAMQFLAPRAPENPDSWDHSSPWSQYI